MIDSKIFENHPMREERIAELEEAYVCLIPNGGKDGASYEDIGRMLRIIGINAEPAVVERRCKRDGDPTGEGFVTFEGFCRLMDEWENDNGSQGMDELKLIFLDECRQHDPHNSGLLPLATLVETLDPLMSELNISGEEHEAFWNARSRPGDLAVAYRSWLEDVVDRSVAPSEALRRHAQDRGSEGRASKDTADVDVAAA